MRIYIESTIPSYLVARPSRDLMQLAKQQATREWWEKGRADHQLFTSDLVLYEITQGEKAMSLLRLEKMQGISVLPSLEEGELFSSSILETGILPASASYDASHIALATVHAVDVVLTWNCKHIANAAINSRLRILAAKLGYVLPTLCTPLELAGEYDGRND